MSVIVVGASGLVGWHLYHELQKQGYDPVGTYYENKVHGDFVHLDITKPEQTNEFFRTYVPKTVFIPASYTDVNGCEFNPEKSFDVNVRGIYNILHACDNMRNSSRIRFYPHIIYFSSGYIFDGEEYTYYYDDMPNPINVYGRHKLQAEHLIMSLVPSEYWTIIRTMFVYGYEPQKKNFVYSVLDRMENNGFVNAHQDHYGTPTYAPKLADFAVNFEHGLYHYSDNVRVSKYSWAEEIADVFEYDRFDVHPVTETNPLVLRPRYAGVDRLGIYKFRTIHGLKDMKDKMEKSGQL